MSRVRALQIDSSLVELINGASDAMRAARVRFDKHGSFGFDGPGLQLVRQAQQACEAIVEASTPEQMRYAREVVEDTLLGKGAYACRRNAEQRRHRMALVAITEKAISEGQYEARHTN